MNNSDNAVIILITASSIVLLFINLGLLFGGL